MRRVGLNAYWLFLGLSSLSWLSAGTAWAALPHDDRGVDPAPVPVAALEAQLPVSGDAISQGLVSTSVATLSAIELSADGTQLIVRTDRAVGQISSGWHQRVTSHRIELTNTQLAQQVMLPDLTDHPNLLAVRVNQVDPTTVMIQLELTARTQVGTIAQPSPQQLVVPLGGTATAGPPVTSAAIAARIAAIELPNVSHSRPRIVIDPGHGGADPGAIGINGLREKDVVLPISLRVAALLEQQGAQVVLTRQDDRSLDLPPRVQIAERNRANVFVSIHANAISLSRPDVNGAETYIYASRDRPVADAIQASLVQATGFRDRGVKSARFHVLVNTSMPSVLVEVGFVTGAEDAPLLADPEFRELIAHAIARGILNYAQTHL
jgi:N-acetylmuramoyl-L-alanine amidase